MYRLHKGHMNSQRLIQCMYPTLHWDVDLVLHAIGVHLEVFLVLICSPGVPSTTSKYTSAVWGITRSSSTSLLALSLWRVVWLYRKGWLGGNLRKTQGGNWGCFFRLPTTGVQPDVLLESSKRTPAWPSRNSKLTLEQAVRSTPFSDSEVDGAKSVGASEGIDLLLPEHWQGSASWLGRSLG